MPADKGAIEAGRDVVDDYRANHAKLYDKPWHRGIPEDHTPLLEIMLAGLKKQGFNSIQEFFDASEELNVQELGFASGEDFDARATMADYEALELKWK